MKHKIGFFIRLFIAMPQSLVIEILRDLIVSVINKFIHYKTFQTNKCRMK